MARVARKADDPVEVPMNLRVRTGLALLAVIWPTQAARLSDDAKRAFEQYTCGLEASPRRFLEVHDANLHVEPVNGGTWAVSGGLLHHWSAAALVAGANREDMLKLLRDYDRLSIYYAPEVASSHAITEHGSATRLAIRLKKQTVLTVVFDAEYDVESGLVGPSGGYGVSRSAHIWQIQDPGTSRERRLPEGDDDGFLWRLNAYWSFVEVHGGLLIQCEAVSLTRDTPTGLAWLIAPIVKQLPRSSLELTLAATRNALRKENHR